MEHLIAAARRLSRWGLWFGGALILLAALLIGVDVTMRRLLDSSIGGADELSGYALAIGFVWALPATLLDRGHIRIDSLYIRFPVTVRVLLDIAGLVCLIFFFALVAWYGYGVMEQSWISGSRSQSELAVPTVIPQAMWWLGFIVFLFVALLMLARSIQLFAQGERGAIAALIGTRSAEDEVEDELRSMDLRKDHTA